MGVPFFEGTYYEIEAQEKKWLAATWDLHLVPPSAWGREHLTRLPDFTYNDLQNKYDPSVPSREEAIRQWDRSRATAIYRHKLGLTPASGFGERLAAKDVTLTNFDFIQYIKSVPYSTSPDIEVVATEREKFLGPIMYGGVNSISNNAESDPTSWASFAYQDNTDRVSYNIIYDNIAPIDRAILDEYQRRHREGSTYWGGGFLNSRAAQDFAKGFIIVAGAVIGGAVLSGVLAPTGGAVAAGGAATTGSGAAAAGAATSSGTLAGSTGLLGASGGAAATGAGSAGVLTASSGAGAAATLGGTSAVTVATYGGGAAAASSIPSWLSGASSAASAYAEEAAAGYVATQVQNAITPKKEGSASSGNRTTVAEQASGIEISKFIIPTLLTALLLI